MIRLRFTSPDKEPIEIGPFARVDIAPDSMGSAVGRPRAALYAHEGDPALMVAAAQDDGWMVLPRPYTRDGEDGAGNFRKFVEIVEVAA